ncbi:MAG TPA: PilZ domain-containing protein [Pyrinomonadaceae bacterium]|nr:PilZ domain-containing protein [Pyrinomonadaceae bacterium]
MWEFVERRAATRHPARLQCRLTFPEAETPSGTRWQPRPLVGYTRDLSASGLAVIVSDLGTAYGPLTDWTTVLVVELELPAGPIEIAASPARVVRLGRDEDERGFLVGLHIQKIHETLLPRYEQYVYALG